MIAVLALAAGVLFGCGTYLVLQRTLTRVVIGFTMLGHGANLVILNAGGRAGEPPLVRDGNARLLADPLAQAMILTAIVISFGVTAFLLALAYRSWQLTHDDQVEDDLEDRRIARMRRPDGAP
jgi:multicomponent Na+:H+ antiporter subunit C